MATPTSNRIPSPSTRRHAGCNEPHPARRRCSTLNSSARSGPPPPAPGTVSPLAAPPKPPKARPLSLTRSLDWWDPAHHRSRISGRLPVGGALRGDTFCAGPPHRPPLARLRRLRPCALSPIGNGTSNPRLRAMDTGPPDRSCGTIRPSGSGPPSRSACPPTTPRTGRPALDLHAHINRAAGSTTWSICLSVGVSRANPSRCR